MAWTYILECCDGSYYVGSTTNLERRVWEHQEGLGALYTRRWRRAKREALIEGRLADLGWLSSRSHDAMGRRGEGGG